MPMGMKFNKLQHLSYRAICSVQATTKGRRRNAQQQPSCQGEVGQGLPANANAIKITSKCGANFEPAGCCIL